MAATVLKSDALMKQMKLHLATDAGKQIVDKIGLVYKINISPKELGLDEVTYVVDLKKGEVKKGDEYEGGKADVTFSFTDEDFLKVATGKMSPQMAFMRGAIKIKGSLSAAQKFTPDIFPKLAKIIPESVFCAALTTQVTPISSRLNLKIIFKTQRGV